MTLCDRYFAARDKIIAADFSGLNPAQLEAAMYTEGPLLILAGAGSGKTTVLISRIANLIKYGVCSARAELPADMDEAKVSLMEYYLQTRDELLRPAAEQLCAVSPAAPWSVLAITFTNKAADELKSRLERKLGNSGGDVWASTFHSACVRILRRDIERLGMSRDFTIYDADDSAALIKKVTRDLGLDEKQFPPKSVHRRFGEAKDAFVPPEKFEEVFAGALGFRAGQIGKIYAEYQKRLRAANALDFDDIIYHTVRLLEENPDIRESWQRRFRYVLVDEYQDTNALQYRLCAALSGGARNLCVVGDDDQSIYRFRGATIENILGFDTRNPDAHVVRLETNYRSTGNILQAANLVIANNRGRKGKNLRTDAGEGEKVTLHECLNETEEANYISSVIIDGRSRGRSFKDYAILYRMNSQSNRLQEVLTRNSIPYRVIGGMRFYERAEIKDMLSYLWVIRNPDDDLRLRRIINIPARGIGQTTLAKLDAFAAANSVSLWKALDAAEKCGFNSGTLTKLEQFKALINDFRTAGEQLGADEIYDLVLEKTGYLAQYEGKEDAESMVRADNIKELKSSIVSYRQRAGEEGSLSGFLDEVALYTDIEAYDADADAVVMMTVHAAKGLEFPAVFVAGAEEGIFPSLRMGSSPEDVEEERRLCYVALTRAREQLYVTYASERMVFGTTNRNPPSRFLDEMGRSFTNDERLEVLPSRFGGGFFDDFDDFDQRPAQERRSRPTYGGYGGYCSYGGFSSKPASAAKPSETSTAPARPAAGPVSPLRSAPSPAAAKPKTALSLREGDMITHKAFGRGMVVSTRPMGGDCLVEIAFDGVGTKRLMINTAAQFIKKL